MGVPIHQMPSGVPNYPVFDAEIGQVEQPVLEALDKTSEGLEAVSLAPSQEALSPSQLPDVEFKGVLRTASDLEDGALNALLEVLNGQQFPADDLKLLEEQLLRQLARFDPLASTAPSASTAANLIQKNPLSKPLGLVGALIKDAAILTTFIKMNQELEAHKRLHEIKSEAYKNAPSPDLKQEIKNIESSIDKLAKEIEDKQKTLIEDAVKDTLSGVKTILKDVAHFIPANAASKALSLSGAALGVASGSIGLVQTGKEMKKSAEKLQAIKKESAQVKADLNDVQIKMFQIENNQKEAINEGNKEEFHKLGEELVALKNLETALDLKQTFVEKIKKVEEVVKFFTKALKGIYYALGTAGAGVAIAGSSALSASISAPAYPVLAAVAVIAAYIYLATHGREMVADAEIFLVEWGIDKLETAVEREEAKIQQIAQRYKNLVVNSEEKSLLLGRISKAEINEQKALDDLNKAAELQSAITVELDQQRALLADLASSGKRSTSQKMQACFAEAKLKLLDVQLSRAQQSLELARSKSENATSAKARLIFERDNPAAYANSEIEKCKKNIEELKSQLSDQWDKHARLEEKQKKQLQADLFGASDKLMDEWKESLKKVLEHERSREMILEKAGIAVEAQGKLSAEEQVDAVLRYIQA